MARIALTISSRYHSEQIHCPFKMADNIKSLFFLCIVFIVFAHDTTYALGEQYRHCALRIDLTSISQIALYFPLFVPAWLQE